MRLPLQIFATIFLCSLLAGGLLMAGIDMRRADQIQELSAALPDGMQGLLSSSDAKPWHLASTLWLLLAAGCIAGVVATWLSKRLFGIVTGGILALLTAFVAYAQPAPDQSAGAMESVGTNVALFGGVGVLLLILLHTKFRAESVAPK